MNSAPTTVPAILALKRFVRRLVKQVGISVVSLMLVIGVATHSATINEPVSAANAQHTDSPTSVSLSSASLSSASLSSASMLSTEAPSMTRQQRQVGRTKPTRLLRSNVLHHHLTGARLSTAAIARPTSTDIAAAK